MIDTLRGLARLGGAQPATRERLAQQPGYRGWTELEHAFASDLGLHVLGHPGRACRLAAGGRKTKLLGELFRIQPANLEATEALEGA